jgi:hypothetical protein
VKKSAQLIEVTITATNIQTEYGAGGLVRLRPRLTITASDSTTHNITVASVIQFYSDSRKNEVSLLISSGTANSSWLTGTCSGKFSDFIGDSTISLLGNPTYVDCEIGEIYKIVNNEIIGINKYGITGFDLPKLSSGANTITYDNTITQLDIVPRWWQV